MTEKTNCGARTKIVWTLSPKSFDEAPTVLAKKIVDFGVSGILTVFVPEREHQYLELRKELDKAFSACDGSNVGFLFSLVGRRAFLFVSDEQVSTAVGTSFEVHFVCDRNACLNRLDPGVGLGLRVAVTNDDMLVPLNVGSLVALGYGETEIVVKEIIERTNTSLKVKAEVSVAGALRSGMDVTSEVFPRGIFPLTSEDSSLLRGVIYDCADAVIVHGASSGNDLRSVRECLGGRTLSKGGADERVPPLLFSRVDSVRAMRAMNESFDIIDGVFLNRSELGVGVHLHDLPFFQKNIISRCNRQGKTVIAASDLLSSMHRNSTPTRAEVSDLANLMLDGIDAVAIGREVTEGPHAELAARYCRETLTSSESTLAWEWRDVKIEIENDLDALASGSFHAAQHCGAKAIVCMTRRGYTAARLSSLRPPIDVVALTYNTKAKRQMNLMKGVRTLLVNSDIAVDSIFDSACEKLQQTFGFEKGDRIVMVSLSTSSKAQKGSNFFLIEEFR